MPGPSNPRHEHVLVIANPVAGRGRGEATARALAQALGRERIVCDLYFTRARGDALQRAAELEPDIDLVVSIGGDGTFSEVLSGLERRDLDVAVLPMGTANVLALDWKIPRDVAGCVTMILQRRVQLLDTGMVNGRTLSFLVCGVGFDAAVVAELEKRRRGPITKRDWFTAGWRAFKSWRPPQLSVEIDGAPFPLDCGMVLVSNVVHYAGFDVLQRDRKLDDGLFEVYMFAGGSRTSLVRHGIRGFFGRFPSGRVSMRRARRVVVRAPEPVPFQVDGDLCGVTPFEFVVGSQPFRLLVP
ncbi:MAG: NAD(+)/NADH kinase [Planctomycetes bacterium]|nr:NAD(+)/NADH kinase [Planctomycetota bacterium]